MKWRIKSAPAAYRVIVQILAAQAALKVELEPLHELHVVQGPALHQLVDIHRLRAAFVEVRWQLP